MDIEFTLNSRFTRLGYYYSERGIRGHAFHYTKPTDETLKRGICRLKKRIDSDGEFGSWGRDMVYGTYLHICFERQVLNPMVGFLNFSAFYLNIASKALSSYLPLLKLDILMDSICPSPWALIFTQFYQFFLELLPSFR